MLEQWLHYMVVIFAQSLFLVICAICEKRLFNVPRIVGSGLLVGIPCGLFIDLVFGKYFGIFSYELGFGVFFLFLNATLSYGLFATNVLLLRQSHCIRFNIWIIAMVMVYESVNYFFPVWIWEVALPPVGLTTMVVVGYLVWATLITRLWHVFAKT